ncbi:MAG: hypothetical protein A2Z25_04715 [Planctomycetes bacterium RBG_16_55_9]|nr:MAG: hypothetical protein A2Z25_04715 [Planctomycetes bacterium RBG_16_55_9]
MYEPEKSLKNAQKLLDASELENVISFRIEPDNGCCCSHCWPLVWQGVNKLIYPQGPIEHEGQSLIKIDNERYILKQNESGPEIMLLICASLNLITSAINLLVAICGSLQKERKCPSKVKIVQRRFIRNQVAQEMLIEVNLDDAKITQDKIKTIIEGAIKSSLVSKKK